MAGVVSELVREVKVPKMVKIKQNFPRPQIDPKDIPEIVRSEMLGSNVNGLIKPGMSIAITAGSRGVSNVALITKSIADVVKELGAHPFVIPAMGSHGGATAEGQTEILNGYGITEEYIGCPIKSSMEVVHIGQTDPHDIPVYIDKNASEADGIIVAGRVKLHTIFRGPYESGIMKMMTIGLGKQYGASVCHRRGADKLPESVPLFGRAIMKNANILFGMAILENPFDETFKIKSLNKQEIEEKEPELLKEAAAMMPKIYLPECDVLVVDKIGKNFSGDGMDPNITGTFVTSDMKGGVGHKKIAILDVSEESHHSAFGLGAADAISRRLYENTDLAATYPNAVTSTFLQAVKIPMILENHKEAIQVCLLTSSDPGPSGPSMIRIPNSLHLEYIWISENLLDVARKIPEIEILSEPEELVFNEEGYLY